MKVANPNILSHWIRKHFLDLCFINVLKQSRYMCDFPNILSNYMYFRNFKHNGPYFSTRRINLPKVNTVTSENKSWSWRRKFTNFSNRHRVKFSQLLKSQAEQRTYNKNNKFNKIPDFALDLVLSRHWRKTKTRGDRDLEERHRFLEVHERRIPPTLSSFHCSSHNCVYIQHKILSILYSVRALTRRGSISL